MISFKANIAKRTLFALACVLIFFSPACYKIIKTNTDICDSAISKIREHAYLPDKYNIKSKKPVKDFCEVILESDNKLLAVYTTDNYVIAGDIFENTKALTRRAKDEVTRKAIIEKKADLEKWVAMKYQPQKRNMDRSIYMAVDTDCPYCHKALDEIMPIAERYGYSIKLMFFSLRDPGKAAKLVAGKVSFFDYATQHFNFDKLTANEADKTFVEQSTKGLKKMGVSGVPHFILEDSGKEISGADMQGLEREIVFELASYEERNRKEYK